MLSSTDGATDTNTTMWSPWLDRWRSRDLASEVDEHRPNRDFTDLSDREALREYGEMLVEFAEGRVNLLSLWVDEIAESRRPDRARTEWLSRISDWRRVWTIVRDEIGKRLRQRRLFGPRRSDRLSEALSERLTEELLVWDDLLEQAYLIEREDIPSLLDETAGPASMIETLITEVLGAPLGASS